MGFRPVERAEPTYDAAFMSLIDREFCKTQKHQEQQMRAVRDGAHPELLLFEKLLVKRLREQGIPMFASEVWRDAKRQNELFIKGTSLARAGSSPHQYGLAVDIIHGTKGWELHTNKTLNKKAWEMIVLIGEELAAQRGLPITNGSHFKGIWDPAHWEHKEWKQLKAQGPWPISVSE